MRLIIFLFVCLITTGIAFAKNCPTDLGKEPRVSDIQRVFDCLNNRISELEAKVGSGGVTGSALDKRMARLKKAAAGKNSVTHRGVAISLDKCGRGRHSNLYCSYKITNTTTEDKKVCFGRKSRLVTDTGNAFSENYDVSVGSKSSSRDVCDETTPLTTVSGWIMFNYSAGKAKGEVQFVRLDCGPGCTLDSFKVPIE